ncbi:PREDICTED: uncharacterized protein LOC109343059 isoform X2 [Lupinus angustifolius]|uniref:uncharacterized protein LOC109343059 isoform X2 n=1 Tax=Lupinus angustifolius TaxID=3871 RepID=UPI00092E7AF4|nr:PREDICTED: uncharacterized protein LOC109343059 isoform X2 [Lupinus angustifolius]
MDPSSIPPPPPPTVVPFTDEPNPPPPPPPTSLPSYADMIYKAIEALKEKNGSTKRAISKYISEVYNPYLPPSSTHSTLLTQNLKRLKDNGFIQMVNNSYMLPRSVPVLPSSEDSAKVSRPRGRPRKVQVQPQELVQVVQQNAEPVWAALGLSDEPQVLNMVPEIERKRLGRPRKSAVAVESVGELVVSGTVGSRGRGRPPGSKNKKKLGRPAKNELVAVVAVEVDGGGSGGVKRRPGRPRKNQQGVLVPLAPAAEGGVPVDLAGGDVPVAVAASIRGRPKRNAGVGSGRGRGRGRGGGTLPAQRRSSFGRPVGRPRKGTTSANTSQNVAADDGDFKRKLEHFQSKVKESLEVLKPYFTHESPLSAIAAIQDLEVLGAMDLNAPLEQDEPLPHQPLQPPPQHHILQQPLALAPQQFFQHQYPQFQQLYQPQQYQNQHQQPPQQFQPQSTFHRLFNP